MKLPQQIKSAYVSIPMSVPIEKYYDAINLVSSVARWWSRDSPYSEKEFDDAIKQADAFILVMPENAWKVEEKHISRGSRRELNVAALNRKPIFIIYETRNDGLKVYFTNYLYGNIYLEGIQGSSSIFWNAVSKKGKSMSIRDTILDEYEPDTESNGIYIPPKIVKPDKRILLLIR